VQKHKNLITKKLYFRFFSVFGMTLSVLVVLIGVVFFRLYSNNMIDDFKSQMEKNVDEIANSIEVYVIQDEYNGFLDYMEAIQGLLTSQEIDVWVMPYYKSENTMKKKYANTTIKYKNLSKGMKNVMKKVYNEDMSASNISYDDIYEEELIRAGAPIHDAGGNVIGGVLLNGVYAARIDDMNRGKEIIVYSLVISWIVSIIISMFLASRLSRPISKIRKTALILADGNYEVKTGITEDGEIGELAGTIDILSERLAQNEKMREDFFANVSHELRTPITVLRGYTESLADGVVTEPEKIKYTLERMLKECDGMKRLVGDLLTLSKIQNPEFEFDKEPVSLVQIFEDAIKSARILGENKHITINFKSNDEYCFMLGDYDRLRQLFLIILDNAVKFSHENSEINVDLQKEEKLTITIQDYGIGIEEEMIPNIFDKFYRSKLRMNEKGSGLGLVIAKEITLKHDGNIDVFSEVGKGTKFTLIFDSIEAPED